MFLNLVDTRSPAKFVRVESNNVNDVHSLKISQTGKEVMEELLSWFEAQGGWVDRSIMALGNIPGQGRGALALKHIPVRVFPSI